MRALLALAGWSVAAAWRDRLYASALLFFVAAGIATPLVSDFALGAPDKAARDVGLSLLWLVGSAMAVLCGVRAIGTELRDGTAALWLTRPIARGTWVAGRMSGAIAAITIELALLLAGWTLVSLWNGVGLPSDFGWYTALLWMELVLVAAWALLFSSLTSSPIAAYLATAGLWAAGHLADEYGRLAQESDGPVLRVAFQVLYAVVPDLDLFDVQDRVVHLLPVDVTAAVWALGYGLAWTLALSGATAVVLGRRDLP